MEIATARQLFMLDRESKGCVEKTLKEYRKSIDKFIRETEVTRLEECTKTTVQAWTVSMKELKSVTANKYLRDVRAFLYFFMEEDDIPKFKIKLLRHQEEPLKLYTDEELLKLIAKPEGDSFCEWRTYNMICFAMGTGARIATICNLKWEDIDDKARLIYYRHTKNRMTACVPLSTQLSSILIRWRLRSLESDYVFPNETGTQLTTEGAYEALKRYAKTRGVTRHSWHGFRHNFAHDWIKANGDLFRLQSMMQHQSLSQTQHYAKVFADDLRGTDKYTTLDIIKRKK